MYSQIGANSDRYEVGVIEHFGRPKTGFPVLLDSQVSRAPGEWPRANPSSPIFAQAAQVIPGGDPEIVVAYDKVQVLNPNGTIATTFPMIDLGAQSLGLQVLDLDHDGSPPEFVIPVLYWQNDDGYIQPAYEDLVAYRRNGTAVANPSWPVHLQMPFWFNHTAPAAHVADLPHALQRRRGRQRLLQPQGELPLLLGVLDVAQLHQVRLHRLGKRVVGQQLHRHITPLSALQKHILSLWDLSPTLYDQLSAAFLEPT